MKVKTHILCYWMFIQLFAVDLKAQIHPNVLCIVVDDLRDELNCYGFEHMHTPIIDRLAKNGTTFTQAYCQKALCGPSRNRFITGMYPNSIGIRGNKDHFRKNNSQQLSLPQHFKEHGYHTQAFGKILHNTIHDTLSWSQPNYYPTSHQYAAPGRENMKAVIDQVPGNEDHPLYEAPDVEDEAYRDGLITQKNIQFLKSSSQLNKPFFAMVGYHKPHTPFNAPKKYWDLYERKSIALAPNPFLPKNTSPLITPLGRYLKGFQNIPDGEFPDPLALEIKHAYYACVSYIDAQVGKLLDTLKETQHLKNTLVVFGSDHGYQLGEHTAWCKHSNFEQAPKVPLVLSAPQNLFHLESTTWLS